MDYCKNISSAIYICQKTNHTKSKIYTLMLCLLCILSLSVHYINTVLFNINPYYVNYICWIILLITEGTLHRKMRIRRNQLIITFVLFVDFLIGATFGEASLGIGVTELHTALFVCLQYFIVFGIDSDFSISKNEVCTVCKVVLLFGIVASLYAMIVQRDNMVGYLLGNNITINGWNYKSFFHQRNSFACLCYLASITACYLFYKERKPIYAMCVVFLGFQIFITNSRTSLLSYLILIFLCLSFSVKKKPLLYLFMAIVVIIAVSYMDFSSIVSERFHHINSAGIDSGEERFSMWRESFGFLYDKVALVSGMGVGTISTLLMPTYGVGSAHNAYVDALFSGGIIYLAVMLYSIWKGYKKICENCDHIFRNIFRAGMISFVVYCMFESLASILTSNYFSVIVTILLFIMPNLYSSDSTAIVRNNPVQTNANDNHGER